MIERRAVLERAMYAGIGGAAALVLFPREVSGPVASGPKSALAPLQASDLGARGDGTGDDGARLTEGIRARVQTLTEQVSTTPIAIDLGDGRHVYNIRTPIRIDQNHVHLVGTGAVLQCDCSNAVIIGHGDANHIVFGVEVGGLTLKGRVASDAIVLKSGSQCRVFDVRNYASVGGSIVRFLGAMSCRTDAIKSDGTNGAVCRSVISEAVYEKVLGKFFNSIANRHSDVLGYACTGPGAQFIESDSFFIQGDFETCRGPGIDIVNGRFGTVTTYMEHNGMGATRSGTDTPDDIRIRSTNGQVVPRASNIAVVGSSFGGVPVNGVTPNNVHVIEADECLLANNFFGGNVAIESGSRGIRVLDQGRFLGKLLDRGQGTVR